MKILGVDPGLSATGYGLINSTGNKITPLDWGVIRSPKTELPLRLNRIYTSLCEVIENSKPDIVAVEEVFSGKNPRTGLLMGHARGVILLAAAQSGFEVREFPTRLIKKSVTGRGGATKDQVSYMVKKLLNITSENLPEDAADALAAAICCVFREKYSTLGMK